MSSNSVTSQIEFIEYQTSLDPDWSVIWLHGLGADGRDFEPVAPQFGFGDSPGVRFIFPHAPMRPITINGGMVMRGWYDIKGMNFDRQEDREGLEQSAAMVESLIEQENRRGIPTANIILAGFSQGGAVALFCGLRHGHRLAAIVALSTYLPDAASTDDERADANSDVPIFMAHGSADPVIPIALAERSRQLLVNMGYRPEWYRYPIPHSVNAEEIRDIGHFLRKIIE